ncbi:ABC transporter permease [Eggerthellaceae bacterium 3-80]|nr:ABC transporter permease [bacterium D16-34]
MQVFKCTLKIIARNKVFPLIYIVGLSFMGLFMSWSFDFEGQSSEFESTKANYAVIDRDQSQLSLGIIDSLESCGQRIDVADNTLAMQDAVAKGEIDYLLIIPSGYEQSFEDAVVSNEPLPRMDMVFSFSSLEGRFVDEQVQNYLGIMQTLMLAYPDAALSQLTVDAQDALTDSAHVTYIESTSTLSAIDRFTFFLQWSTYSLFAGIVVCVGMLCTTFARVDVRRRNLVSSLSFAAYSAQLMLSCFVFVLMTWVWTFALAIIAFPTAAQQIGVLGLVWCALSVLTFCLVPLAVGYLLGQIGATDIICNAVGNIVGMVLSFLGGAWVPLDLMAPEITAIAHWFPCYWYNDACLLSAHLSTGTDATGVVSIVGDLGVLLLFAAALFGVALLIGRLRTQTMQAGGNGAAAVVVR